MKIWMIWGAQLIAALALVACSVQLVSPYNAQLADGLSKLHDDVLKFSADVARTAMDPATKNKAAYENYVKTYDGFQARVETMRVISEIGNPGVVSCGKLMSALSGAARTDLVASGGASSTDSTDCQTFLFVRLRDIMNRMADEHRMACPANNPNFRNDCIGGFGAASGVIRFGDDSTGLIVQPTLLTIRTLMWVQEAKKPPKS